MKLFNYLEALVTNPSVIEDFIIPTLKNKGTFWVPLKGKYTSSLLPKKINKFYQLRTNNLNNFLNIKNNSWIPLKSNWIASQPVKKLKAFHQLGVESLNKFLNIKRNVAISTFTSTYDIDNLLKEAIGSAGFGLVALVEGTPIVSSPKDLRSRREENRRWVNFDKNISFNSYQDIKDDVVQKIKKFLDGKEISSLNEKERNKLISFYYKTVWETLKEKNSNNTNFYKHLSFKNPIKDLLFSKPISFKGNRSNDMSYNEIIMNNIKIKKIYYSDAIADKIDTTNKLFVPFDADSFHIDLMEIQKQNL
jgi:hypothetical protein